MRSVQDDFRRDMGIFTHDPLKPTANQGSPEDERRHLMEDFRLNRQDRILDEANPREHATPSDNSPKKDA